MAFNLGLFLLRFVLGIIFLGHGTQKVFGWFGGPGLKGFSGATARMGLRPALFWSAVAGLAEAIGGLLLVLGLLTPLGALAVLGVMLLAILKVHWPKGFWNSKGGFEFNLILLTAALALGLTGPGAWSLDAWLALPIGHPVLFLIASGVVALGVGALHVLSSRVVASSAQQPASSSTSASQAA